jgi:hypothetical protein
MAALSSAFHKLMGSMDAETFSTSEEHSINELARVYAQFVRDGGRVNTKSEPWHNSCAAFLDSLNRAATKLRLETAPRKYRTAFTVNYRALFPDDQRHYRVDVLRASIDQCAAIWVNGDTFEFSPEVIRLARGLQSSWAEVGSILERWEQSIDQSSRRKLRPSRSEMHMSMVTLDRAWASFEHKYISELIGIEEKARKYLVAAVEHESRMSEIEATFERKRENLNSCTAYIGARQEFISCLARLNSVANVRRKGRDDMTDAVLVTALAVLQDCKTKGCDPVSEVAKHLATDVVDSFNAIRFYVRQVGECLECVDPNLCKNAGLVARLVDWEESWEIGSQYVQKQELLKSVCNLVAKVKKAQHLVPALTTMCEDCDVELFLVLPRMVWLCYLTEPDKHQGLVGSLLPHRFAKSQDAELTAFVEQFQRVMRSISRVGGVERAENTLVHRSVLGSSSVKAHSSRDEIESFMLELERWSMELQRKCPEDWNQCSSVLIQCLTGGSQKERSGEFVV